MASFDCLNSKIDHKNYKIESELKLKMLALSKRLALIVLMSSNRTMFILYFFLPVLLSLDYIRSICEKQFERYKYPILENYLLVYSEQNKKNWILWKQDVFSEGKARELQIKSGFVYFENTVYFHLLLFGGINNNLIPMLLFFKVNFISSLTL